MEKEDQKEEKRIEDTANVILEQLNSLLKKKKNSGKAFMSEIIKGQDTILLDVAFGVLDANDEFGYCDICVEELVDEIIKMDNPEFLVSFLEHISYTDWLSYPTIHADISEDAMYTTMGYLRSENNYDLKLRMIKVIYHELIEGQKPKRKKINLILELMYRHGVKDKEILSNMRVHIDKYTKGLRMNDLMRELS